jgi:hypothetical protein
MGGSQSREKALDRWLSQKKDLTALISSNGGLNSHLSIGLYQLAVSVSCTYLLPLISLNSNDLPSSLS